MGRADRHPAPETVRTSWVRVLPHDRIERFRPGPAPLSTFCGAFAWKDFSSRLSVAHEVRDTIAQLYDYERTGGELSFVWIF